MNNQKMSFPFAFISAIKRSGNDNVECPRCKGKFMRIQMDNNKAILQCTECFYEVYYKSLEHARNIRT